MHIRTGRTVDEESQLTTPSYAVCPECGTIMFPVLPSPSCGHLSDPVEQPLTDTGEVYAWTRAWQGDTATVMAMVDFFDGRLRVNGPVAADSIAIGDRVVVAEADATPFEFRPA